MSYAAGVGGTRADREDARARTAYVAAARRFVQAVAGYVAVGVPLEPGVDRELPPWSRTHVTALLELQAALGELVSARRTYDSERRRR